MYSPRGDERLRAPRDAGDIHRARSRWLVDRFVAAGAELVFVGPDSRLTGPSGVVSPLANHDNHLHVRLPAP